MTIDITTRWFVETCAKCSVQWAMPAGVVSALRRSHETFWCPRCCASWHYAKKNDLELALEAQARAEERAKRAEQIAQSAENSRRVTRGHLTRVKRRIAAGACPCCKRSFSNLARHMAGQHPGYAGEES